MSYEENLQQDVERGNASPEDKDAHTYYRVFDALNKAPDMRLQSNFAEKVIQKALAVEQKRESLRDFWWLALGCLMLIIFAIIAFAYAAVEVNFSALHFLSPYKGFLVVAVVMWLGFNVVERKLFHSKTDHQ